MKRACTSLILGALVLAACERVHVAQLDWIDPPPEGMKIIYSHLEDETGNSFTQRPMTVVLQTTKDVDSAAMQSRLLAQLKENGWRLFKDPPNAAAKYDREGGCVFPEPLTDQEGVPERIKKLPGPLLYVHLSFC